jgi:lipopolysaccharide/colanic/teichoic acid biosynthesis glycosyltransferase
MILSRSGMNMSPILVVNRTQAKPIDPPFEMAKRLVDLTLSLLLLPFFAIITVLVGIAIKLDSPGPVFFKQKRIGKGGREFAIYKFRTMQHIFDRSSHQEFMKKYIQGQIRSGDENGTQAVYKPPAEDQITRVGWILRKTSIDELPQLWNILLGEMTLVGPRPNVPWEVEAYDSWHNERLEVKPGITGLAQVKGRSGIPFEQLVKYDVEYVKNRSVGLDLKIIWWTMTVVLRGNGSG